MNAPSIRVPDLADGHRTITRAHAPLLRQFAEFVFVTVGYIVAGKLGLTLAFVNSSATAVWPPTGIALAAILLRGARISPAIFLGAFIVNATTAGTFQTSFLIACGNTLEALLGAYLVNRFAGGRFAFDNGRNIFLFVVFAGFVSTGVSATIGVTALSLFGFGEWAAYSSIWLTWWLGDASGALVFTPAVLLWITNPHMRWSGAQRAELFAIAASILLVGWMVFVIVDYPVGFLCLPFCLWPAYRFGQREAATATCLLSLVAIWGTADGRGTFAGHSINESLLLLQTFMAVTSIVGITVAAAVSDRRAAEEQLRHVNEELESRVLSRSEALQTAVDQLAASEARLAEAQEVANTGNWEWNVLDNTEFWSDQLYRIFGVEPKSFSPTFETFLKFLHPDDRAGIREMIRRTLADHQPFQCDNRIVRPNGEIRILHVRGRVLVNDAGQVVRFLGIAQDITDRKVAEQVLANSERRLHTIIDAEPACVKVVSPDGTLIDMNPAGLEMLGADTLAQIRGGAVLDLIHPADRKRFREAHVAASNGLTQRLEFRIVGLNGVERWVDSQMVPFDLSTDRAGTQSAVLSVTTDVTEHKRLEEQLRQSHKMEAVGVLAGGVAHDFNNLLTAIAGYTDLTLETLDRDDSRRADLLEVRKASERAAALTRQLLAFSRRQVLQTKVLDANALIADVHKLFRRTIPEHITLILDLDPALEPVRADPGQLERVFLNLAVNAADAMPNGGELRIATSIANVDERTARRRLPITPGRYIKVEVSDTGVGMSAETLTRIFEPFFTTKERGKSTGLGLATVYGIVKQSGGFIWVDSEEGGGTTFEIYLPAVDERIEPTSPVTSPPEAVGGTETILLAEDDGAVRRLAADVLRKHGYTVLEARDGEEAQGMAETYQGSIDMLVTDVVMPGLSGSQLAERLLKLRPNVLVLYSSGYSENMTRRSGFEEGLPLLEKPYLPKALLYKVREVLDGTVLRT